ncbi:lipid A deacylase LpxR family protein [Reyranella sp.]|uniref:lipid A deacylase LpxR family protein n=1 Tax=Reyranella sp. TaxID=1929291 RepID=UPI003BAB5F27
MTPTLARIACVAAMTAWGTAAAIAQERSPAGDSPPASATADERRNIFSFQVDNDVFNRFSPTDRDYTNGVRFGWLSPAITAMPAGLVALTTVPTFLGEAPADSVIRRFGVSVGQNIYTPDNTFTAQPIYNDRPYAAWLYAAFALQYTYKRRDGRSGVLEPVRLDTLQVDVGLIGPAAGGEFVQNNFHRLIGVSPAYGWANQLHNEPTFDIAFERRWRTARRVVIEDPRLEVDFIPRVGASLGNVAIYADVGGTARIGKNLRDDFGPTRARPSLPGSEAFIGDGSFGWYLFAGVDGQAVGRNIFLDGNTDGASLRVSHRPFVAEAQAGLAVTWRGVRVAYTQVLRSPDFYEQGRWTQFGSLNVTFRY